MLSNESNESILRPLDKVLYFFHILAKIKPKITLFKWGLCFLNFHSFLEFWTPVTGRCHLLKIGQNDFQKYFEPNYQLRHSSCSKPIHQLVGALTLSHFSSFFASRKRRMSEFLSNMKIAFYQTFLGIVWSSLERRSPCSRLSATLVCTPVLFQDFRTRKR